MASMSYEHIVLVSIVGFFIVACFTTLGFLLFRRLWVRIFITMIFSVLIPLSFYLIRYSDITIVSTWSLGAILGYSIAGMIELRRKSG